MPVENCSNTRYIKEHLKIQNGIVLEKDCTQKFTNGWHSYEY